MRKAFKKLLASLLALAMVCALAAPVFADTTSQGSFDKHSFNGYQIFTGTYDATSKKLTNVEWGTGVKSHELLQDLISEFPTTFTAGMTAQQVAKQLDGWGATDDNTIKFTKVVSGCLADTPTCSNVSSTTLKFPTAGYYLVVDASVLSDHDAASMTMLKVQDAGDITITSKVVKPTLDVKILRSGHDSLAGWGTDTGYQTGDTVKIRLTATLPESADRAYDFYEAYRIAFSSFYSGGIDAANLSVESATITETNGTAIALTPGSYTNAHDPDTQSFTFTTGDLKLPSVDLNKGATVEVVYTTTLTSSAATTFKDSTGPTANTFSTTLHYFNDPKNSAAANDPVVDYSTQTPYQNVFLFTYGVKNTKYKDEVKDGNQLAGAGFTLYDSTGTTPIKLNQDSSDRYYYPVNYAGAMTEIFSSTDGTFNFKGLAPGTYILKETTTPTGYNTCEDITIKIISRTSIISGPIGGQATADLSGSDKMINEIVDHSGVVLPSTGGIGTTIFYVVGGLLMVGAAVLLVTKKRMQKN